VCASPTKHVRPRLAADVVPGVCTSEALERRVTHQAEERERLRVDAEGPSIAEHILAIYRVSHAAAAVSAADAGGGGAATTVRRYRQPSPALAADDAGGGAPTAVRDWREPSPAPAADAAGGGAPTTVRHQWDPRPAPRVVNAGAFSLPPSPPRPSFLTPAILAVYCNLPKSMGSSLGWTDEDRVPLCRAYLEVSGDPVLATGRSKDDLWAADQKTWTERITDKGPLRVNCNGSALEK